MKKLLLISALATPLLTGCIVAVSDGEVDHNWAGHSNWQKTQKNNREKISELSIGADYQHVLNTFNTPDFTELVKKGDSVYQVLYFATNSRHSDGKVTKDECTPLVFKDAKLIGFGSAAMSEIL
ncbi:MULTISPECIES: DUF3192 domain-containing protein [Pseudoalteromonas]|uniref:DUF3192 domain-containing protein n=1 Tax=Pseudoalteromonas amylolytica TaxID=1859457 RepID=A0A1S1MSV6_9GAMM|nr:MULTISPECIES: DUF3192 domain-containing protein [Pseudoalteromonas]MCF6436833.1 DUF3192 domain-containing protein [Pseudoalteromonas sp. MMG022]OHU88425.1 hypothetical protein BFC16_06935 [Pseudoalteromonas sp. JW3]OHU90268.1 hypothetical protein BET10_12765 [Pseudoalteromonas amylolytica]